MDCSPPGSSVHGILQARILEWVAISFSKGSSSPRDWARHVSCIGWWFLLLLNHLESTKTAAQEGLGLWIWILDCKPGLGGTIPSLNLFISSSPPTLQRRVWSPFIKPPREDFLKKKKKIYLFSFTGICCGTWDLRSSLQQAGSLVEAGGISFPDHRGNPISCIGSAKSTREDPKKGFLLGVHSAGASEKMQSPPPPPKPIFPQPWNQTGRRLRGTFRASPCQRQHLEWQPHPRILYGHFLLIIKRWSNFQMES